MEERREKRELRQLKEVHGSFSTNGPGTRGQSSVPRISETADEMKRELEGSDRDAVHKRVKLTWDTAGDEIQERHSVGKANLLHLRKYWTSFTLLHRWDYCTELLWTGWKYAVWSDYICIFILNITLQSTCALFSSHTLRHLHPLPPFFILQRGLSSISASCKYGLKEHIRSSVALNV